MDFNDIRSSFLEQAREFLSGSTLHEMVINDHQYEMLELTMLVIKSSFGNRNCNTDFPHE